MTKTQKNTRKLKPKPNVQLMGRNTTIPMWAGGAPATTGEPHLEYAWVCAMRGSTGSLGDPEMERTGMAKTNGKNITENNGMCNACCCARVQC